MDHQHGKRKIVSSGVFMASRNFQNRHCPYNVRTYYFCFSFCNTKYQAKRVFVKCSYLVWFVFFISLN